MLLLFVHGWSVTNTETYGQMPELIAARANAAGLEIEIQHIYLGRYISFDDEVTMNDVVRAFDTALRNDIPVNKRLTKSFSCITHSTGGPVVREWIEHYYPGGKGCPLDHLIMLAPANHGSPLATLGKARVGRIKAFVNGVEPGTKILDWLSLGSEEQWELSEKYLTCDYPNQGVYPFVLTGQTIDNKLYDFLNRYLVEEGSDGVVRASGANMNYTMITLTEDHKDVPVKVRQGWDTLSVRPLVPQEPHSPQPSPFGVVPNASHSGDKIGIMLSPTTANSNQRPVINRIMNCLKVTTPDAYSKSISAFKRLTTETQRDELDGQRYTTLTFRIRDDAGNPINDYDLFLLGGPNFKPDKLPKGFYVDDQQNKLHKNHLIYYVNYDVMTRKNTNLGIRVVARPKDGLAYYQPVEFKSDSLKLSKFFQPNQTLYIDIVIHRRVKRDVFRLDDATKDRVDFKKGPRSKEEID
ncbi:hypothetical protein V5T82_05650 [Magnetovibrio sp. PR-2]|uniref:hypothetical protein n=1 Tax=Magnetovibrio sp. PR-2 TaxID=3120356 RepID=UPI002FCE42C1